MNNENEDRFEGTCPTCGQVDARPLVKKLKEELEIVQDKIVNMLVEKDKKIRDLAAALQAWEYEFNPVDGMSVCTPDYTYKEAIIERIKQGRRALRQ